VAVTKPKLVVRKSPPKTARVATRQIASYPALIPAGW
jgi:hypothetical protein